MIREYNIIVNGSKLANGTGKLQVNGNTDVRRCIVNGTDVINNTGEMTFTLSISGQYSAWSEYYNSCSFSEDDSWQALEIDSLSISSGSSDFQFLSGDITIYSLSETLIPTRHFTSLPYSFTNLQGWSAVGGASGGASGGWEYIIYVYLIFRVKYVPTGETFTLTSTLGVGDGSVGNGTYNWTEVDYFSSTQTQTLTHSVKQY